MGGKFKASRSWYNEIGFMKNGFDLDVLNELVRVSKGINIYLFCSKQQLADYIQYFENKNCIWQILSWHKSNPAPLFNGTHLPDTEFIFFARSRGNTFHATYKTARTYFITPINQKEKKKYGHPTIKPVDILIPGILNSSDKGQVILDPFMGSGSIGVAARRTGRKFIGIELNGEYFKTAEQRISEAELELNLNN